MDVPLSEAVAALQGEIAGLLADPGVPALAPEVTVLALSSHLSGIGGLVGRNEEPSGEILARRVEARVTVRVKANTLADLAIVEAAATTAIVGADPVLLRSRGVRQIVREVEGTDVVLAASDGLSAPAGKDLRFNVLYEHVRLPTAPSGLIEALPQDVTTADLSRATRTLYDLQLDEDPLADFDIVDDPDATDGPSAWSYAAAEQELRQSSSITGGSNNVNASKIGTYLVLRPAVLGQAVADFVLHAQVRSDASGGIGLVFRFADVETFGFFVMNRPAPYRLLGRQAAGVAALLGSDGADTTAGYEPGQWHRLRLLAQGERFELAVDERVVLEARDRSLEAAGSVGFMCRNNASARFRQLRLLAL